MIFIYSDFGVNGPYSGTMRSVVMRNAPEVLVCDLMLDAPDRNPKAASYLLAALRREFSTGDVVLAVVDPGVGSARKGLVVQADGVTYVGPDNGLFEMIIRQSHAVSIKEIVWAPKDASASFHGRDIFAPIAAMLATNQTVELCELPIAERCLEPHTWPDELSEVIYIDTYGNLMTGMAARKSSEKLVIDDQVISGARTFSDIRPGEGFHYCNSIGLCEVAVNCGRADQMFGACIGTPITVR